MKTYFLEIEPSAMQVSFDAENSKVYEVRLDGLKFGPFVYVNDMEVPVQANTANDPSSVFVTCEENRINVHFTSKGAYGAVVLIEQDDIDDSMASLISLLNSVAGKLDTANSLLCDIKTNTGRIQ